MKYFVIRKRIVGVAEQEADQIVAIVNKEKIAIDVCKRFPNMGYEKIVVGKGKYLYREAEENK